MSHNAAATTTEEQEEDWSSFFVTRSLTAGETNEDPSYCFQHYPQQRIQWVNDTVIELQHMEELSPMDMVQLSQASHDATGHKVWWGAYLFLWNLVSETNNNNNRLFLPPKEPSTTTPSKNVLELGCGTGLAGIALCLAFPTVVRSMVFTDADQDVLNLCRINCQRNLSKQQQPEWSTQQLVWGREEDNVDCSNSNSSYDIVLATDVLYSVSLLEPLLRTVQARLQRGGFFWLSHVPRATLDGDHATVSSTPRLEWHIQQQAHLYGLSLSHTIRPHQLLTTTSSSSFSLGEKDESCGCTLQQLQETGAAILIFQKQ